MKCSTTILFLFLFRHHSPVPTAEASGTKWFNLIESRELLYYGRVASARMLFDETDGDDGGDMESFLSRHPVVSYTALKCKYADIVIDVLQLFYELDAFCTSKSNQTTADNGRGSSATNTHPETGVLNCAESTVKRFNGLKTYIVKMVYNLFFYWETTPALRTTDQSLLKTLISTNLFLCYSDRANLFAYGKQTTAGEHERRDCFEQDFGKNVYYRASHLGKSIVQIIGLTEQFRCKNCRVGDPYKNNIDIRRTLQNRTLDDIDAVAADLLRSILDPYRLLFDIETVEYTAYNEHMYDPEYLLFHNLISNKQLPIGDVQVSIKHLTYTITDFYEIIKVSYNIDSVHEFQGYLFNIIANLFYVHISASLKEPPYEAFDQLLSIVNRFVSEIIPNNCSGKYCKEIISRYDITVFYYKFYRASNDEMFMQFLYKDYLFYKDNKTMKWNQTDENNRTNGLELLSSLIDQIKNDSQFKSFSQVTKLLSYEAHTNTDYSIVKVRYTCKPESSKNENTNSITNRTELRNVLLLFWMSLANRDGNHLSLTPTVIPSSSLATDIRADKTSDTAMTAIVSYANNTEYFLNAEIDFPSIFENNNVNVIKKMPKVFRNSAIGRSIVYTMNYVSNVYLSYDDYYVVQYMLVPLLLRFRYTQQVFNKMSPLDWTVLQQVTLATICAIENHEIKNFEWQPYSIELYTSMRTERDGKTQNPVTEIDERLKTKVLKHILTINVNNVNTLLNKIYNTYIEKICVSNINDKQLQFSWNGEMLYGYEVFRDVSQSVFNMNDILRFHWFMIKTFIVKVLVKLNMFLSLYKKQTFGDELKIKKSITTKIQNVLDYLFKLGSSKSIHFFLINKIRIFLYFLKDDVGVDEILIQNYFHNEVMQFGVNVHISEFDNVNDALSALSEDVKSFKILLEDILDDADTTIASNMTLAMSLVPK